MTDVPNEPADEPVEGPPEDEPATDQAVADDDGTPAIVPALRRTRKVLWIAVAVAVPLALLIGVLATRQPSATVSAPSPLVGKPAPPIESTTVDGQPAGLAELRGKWVVVNFFATWCVPCRQEHADLVHFSEEHADTAEGDARVLAVVYSDNNQAVQEFRNANGGTWPMLTDPKGRIALDYGVSGVPESYLISPDGIVVAKLLGGVRTDDLDQLLNRAKTGQ
ncbi:MAG TPA: redoxin domain-containing protein [Acidimicrobiales bacterium]|jgi:cytochrome c biogenesis protein CcmG/thiol:disulfide interchange protein DsbE|nr:redoxin domain-containing protein [Acidimicrobiales bacterium]